jgi:hypothetical protein
VLDRLFLVDAPNLIPAKHTSAGVAPGRQEEQGSERSGAQANPGGSPEVSQIKAQVEKMVQTVGTDTT